MQLFFRIYSCILVCMVLFACTSNHPIVTDRYTASNEIFKILARNVAIEASLEKVAEIDHSRLGAEFESYIPPSKVLLFSNKRLEAELLRGNRLAAIDLPLRVLTYESAPGGPTKVIYNSLKYISSRYGIRPSNSTENMFKNTMELVLSGIDKANIAAFTQDSMQPDGIITIDSLYNFKDTYRRVLKAINSQEDTIIFGVIDFQARALEFGLKIPPTTLILFGAPAPGAKAMRNSPTLGLDAFCQKFLVWEDDRGTHLSFNDLLLLAERQGTNKNFALRVIDFRLKNTFAKALRE